MDGNPGRNLVDFFIPEACHDCKGRNPMIDKLSVKKSNLLCENELKSKNLIKKLQRLDILICWWVHYKEFSKVDTFKHNRWWYSGYGGGDISKNVEIIENEKKQSVMEEISGLKVSEII